MSNGDGTIVIIFNGEIYNFKQIREELVARGHRFVTSSDTETVINAYQEYGEACVDKLNGMFAFAVWDGRRDRLFLARDRFGTKPMFIYNDHGVLLFGSEIKALLAYPGLATRLNLDAVWDYLVYRYVPGPSTLFKGIYKLPPGCTAVWQDGCLTNKRYFSPPDQQARTPAELPADPPSSFLEQLDKAVCMRMMSDVPYGAFLSGGIDSSAVVGLMSRHSVSPVKTFSVGFAEHRYSELEYARTVAEKFGTEHHELMISEKDIMDQLPKLIGFRDAPVSEPSDIPIYLLSVETRRSVKMVLTGEGSDEVLAGYPKHVVEPHVRLYQKIPPLVHRRLVLPLVKALPYRFNRAKIAIQNLGLRDARERLPSWFGALSYYDRDALAAFRPANPSIVQSGVQFDTPQANSPLRRILYFDQTSWLPDNLLERGDRMTMAASLEARMPFLDHELVTFVSSLPDHYRLQGRQTKRLLREAMTEVLPRSILDRSKMGFKVPVNEWFRGPMRDYLYDHLAGPESTTRNYYHHDRLDKILDEHVRGRQNHEKLLWTLLNLEIWHRQYM